MDAPKRPALDGRLPVSRLDPIVTVKDAVAVKLAVSKMLEGMPVSLLLFKSTNTKLGDVKNWKRVAGRVPTILELRKLRTNWWPGFELAAATEGWMASKLQSRR